MASERLDRVAEAIYNDGSAGQVPYCAWGELSDFGKKLYRAVAQAAIDALELTEEWAVSEQIGESTYISPMPTDRVAAVVQRVNGERTDSAQAVSRLVSPWCAEGEK